MVAAWLPTAGQQRMCQVVICRSQRVRHNAKWHNAGCRLPPTPGGRTHTLTLSRSYAPGRLCLQAPACSLVRRKMARETCCARMVVFALKVTNLLLFTLAFCLCGAASWMWGAFVNEQRHQHGGDAPPSPQGRSPAPWWVALRLCFVVHSSTPCGPVQANLSCSTRRFIFAIAALGASVLLTSVAGLCGACGGSGRNVWLHLYSFLLVLLLLLQASQAHDISAILPRGCTHAVAHLSKFVSLIQQLSVSVALFADPKINSRLPPDPTGNQVRDKEALRPSSPLIAPAPDARFGAGFGGRPRHGS